jgi:acyl-lipid omega-6 desaturase (Delta-12 desaturase)
VTASPTVGPASVAAFARPRLSRSLLDLLTSVVAFLLLSALMYWCLDVSYLLTLAIAVPAGGFLVRTFIVFHDCAHGSFFRSSAANTWVGRFCGLLVFAPFAAWRHEHAVHHATSGDLDRRGVGDVPTLTVAEYEAMPILKRVGYRAFRNPLVMFGLGPIFAMILAPRFISLSARPRLVRSVVLTNLALAAVVAGLCVLVGWRDFLLVWGPPALIAGSVGVWLFYVQHQFEDTYWESSGDWSYADAALRGSSYLRLPQPLQFFTGNIGLHHVHHLSTRVPNYNLQRAHDETPILQSVPTLSLWDGLRTARLKLWDEESGKLVGFSALRRQPDSSLTLSDAT